MTHTYPDLLALAATCPPHVPAVGPGAATAAAAAGAQAESSSAAGSAPGATPGSTSSTPDLSAGNLLERRLAEALCLDVLGERENGNVVVFASHPERRKTVEIRDCDRLSYARLLQIAGPPVLACVVEGDDKDVFSKFSLTQCRNALCGLAGARRLGDEALVGPGCWQPLDEHGDDLAGVLLVGAGEAAHWDGERLHRITTPRACGRLLDLSTSQPWYDFDTLSGRLADYTSAWGVEVVNEAAALFARWRWKHPKTHPMTIVGLLLASWVQTLWPWRPHVALIGASKSGKSTLLETLDDLFCGLAIRSSKSSAAGIRQRVRNSASIVMVDEFEHGHRRKEVLELARLANRGDQVLLGTLNRRGEGTLLRQIFWIAAIEVGLKRAPDQNRYISLESLLPLKADKGKLSKPATSGLHILGTKLLAIALRSAGAAKALAVRLKAIEVEGTDSRVIESYAVPAVILASACGFTDKEAEGVLRNFLAGAREVNEGDDEEPSDERELLREIAAADMRGDRGVTVTVAEALSSMGVDNSDLLGRHGVTLCSARRGPKTGEECDFLFIDHRVVASKLLRGTGWEDQNLDAILARLEGARKSRRTVGKRHARGVLIPWSWVREHVVDDGQLGFEGFSPPEVGVSQ